MLMSVKINALRAIFYNFVLLRAERNYFLNPRCIRISAGITCGYNIKTQYICYSLTSTLILLFRDFRYKMIFGNFKKLRLFSEQFIWELRTSCPLPDFWQNSHILKNTWKYLTSFYLLSEFVAKIFVGMYFTFIFFINKRGINITAINIIIIPVYLSKSEISFLEKSVVHFLFFTRKIKFHSSSRTATVQAIWN